MTPVTFACPPRDVLDGSLRLAKAGRGSEATFVNIGNASASDAAWAPISVTYTLPACATGYTEITFYEEGPAAGIDLYLDDVSWRETL